MPDATYASRLRYLDAHDVNDSVVDFDGMEVRGHNDEELGHIDGFIVDAINRRVYYAVVDAGGWFSSKRFLLPIGHARLDRTSKTINADLSRDALKSYPRYNEEQFSVLSDDDLRAFERTTADACCPGDPLGDVAVGAWHYDNRRHYSQPDWWREDTYVVERLRPVNTREAGVVARETGAAAPAGQRAGRSAGSFSRSERDEIVAREGDDVSPHYGGRAQPGDILGIETGGETTNVGDTAEDENERRRAAEQSAPREEPRKPGR